MELRKLLILTAFLLVAVLSQRSESRKIQKRDANDEINYDEQADAASDDEAQNDAEGDEDEDEGLEQGVILTQPAYYNVTIGSKVRLECKVSSQGAVLQWSKNNVALFLGLARQNAPLNKYSLDSNDLIVKDIQPEDSGIYECKILQMVPVQIQHTVAVLEAPRIVKLSATDNGRVREGADLMLTCEVAGSPPPQILWTRERENGNERLKEGDGEFSANSVIIRNVRREHSGRYYCYVFNRVGNSQAELTVTVYGKPRVKVHKTVVNSAINVQAILECSAHEEPPFEMRWYKDGYPVQESETFLISRQGHHSNLTVIPTRDTDFGTFTCEAENSYGKHNRSVELVQRPVVEDVDVSGARLSWRVHSHQPLEDILLQLRDVEKNEEWKTISVPLPTQRDHEYELVYELDPDSVAPGQYDAIVKVKNNNSWSTLSEAVRMEIEAQPQYIQTASVLGGNAHADKPVLLTVVLPSTLMYLLVRMF